MSSTKTMKKKRHIKVKQKVKLAPGVEPGTSRFAISRSTTELYEPQLWQQDPCHEFDIMVKIQEKAIFDSKYYKISYSIPKYQIFIY